MYIKCQEYWVDPQERHLGKRKECELIAEKYEVEDAIIERIMSEGTYADSWLYYFIDDVSEYDIEINAENYIDVEMVANYIDNLEEDEEITLDALYAAAFVKAPKDRK